MALDDTTKQLLDEFAEFINKCPQIEFHISTSGVYGLKIEKNTYMIENNHPTSINFAYFMSVDLNRPAETYHTNFGIRSDTREEIYMNTDDYKLLRRTPCLFDREIFSFEGKKGLVNLIVFYDTMSMHDIPTIPIKELSRKITRLIPYI
ncbi:MAG: hypothetical protein AABW92_03645 [Nanoarchaeota archaeon]